MLTITDVSKSFKANFWEPPFVALNEASLSLPEQSLTGFLGANGAGKTTLIKILMGFIKADSGEIHFNKRMGKNRKEIFSNLGYIPERPYFYPDLTGREYLTYMGRLNRLSLKIINEKSKHWSERLLIDFALDRKLRSYSKGMLQRLGFASSLIHDPKLIIMDEPLSGLDPIGRKDFKTILVELNKEGKTIFLSSHIVSDIEEICKDVVVIEKGKILYNGTVKKLIEDNVRPNCFIRIMNRENNKFITPIIQQKNDHGGILVEVSKDDLQPFLKECLESKSEIYSVEYDRPRLEEVIYKIKD